MATGQEALVQLNWVQVLAPTAQATTRTNDGTRVWFQTRLLNASGAAEVWCREKAALSLANCSNSADFEQAIRQGTLTFPLLSAVRVSLQADRSDQASQDKKVIRAVIVEAAAQEFDEASLPTKAIEELVQFTRQLPQPTTGLVPTLLGRLQGTPHYPMVIVAEGVPRYSEKALVLVATEEKSTTVALPNGVFRVTTSGLLDVLSEKPVQGSLTALCTAQNLTEFKLTPPKALSANSNRPRQSALVILSGVDTDAFIVEDLRPIQPEDMPAVRKIMAILVYIGEKMIVKPDVSAAAAEIASEGAEQYLHKARKSRRLSRNPTDAPFELDA